MPSKANVAGHPIHPMLVYFPVAFWILAFVLDVVYEAGGGGNDLVQFSFILLVAGFAMALAAAIPGLMEVRGQRGSRSELRVDLCPDPTPISNPPIPQFSIIVDEYTK